MQLTNMSVYYSACLIVLNCLHSMSSVYVYVVAVLLLNVVVFVLRLCRPFIALSTSDFQQCMCVLFVIPLFECSLQMCVGLVR